MTIQQPDGSVNSYSGVSIKVIHNVLYITSPDGKGTLVISRAACSYQGEVFVCLPTAVALVQGGATKPVDLLTGTIYANTTDHPLQLPLSSRRLPPNGILFSMSTKIGTYVNLSGTVDKVTK